MSGPPLSLHLEHPVRAPVAASPLRRFRRILIILLVACVAGCASDEERFEEHLAQAEVYRTAGQLKEAVLEARQALQVKPQDALANQRLADLYLESGDHGNALFFYREAQRLDARWVEPLLAEFPLILGNDPERAKEIVETALELAPDDPRVYRNKSELKLVLAMTDQALAAALTALELAPDDSASHMALGTVYQAKIREQLLAEEPVSEEFYRSAIEAFERADSGDWSSLQARIQKARTLGSWPGKSEEAHAAFQASLDLAVELDDRPHRLLIAEEMVKRARRIRNSEMEERALEAIVALEPEKISARDRAVLGDPEPRIRRAWVDLANLREREEPGAGGAVLERLIQAQPEEAQARLIYARFLNQNGRSQEALAHLEESAGQGVEPALLLDEAVGLALENGEGQTARRYVERLEVEQPGHVRTLLATARMALATRSPGKAAELLGLVNEREESAESQRLLALAELQLANLEVAQRAVARSLELEPRSPAALRLKARIHYQQGDWAAVLEATRRLRATRVRLRTEDRLLQVRPLYQLGRLGAGRRVLNDLLATDPPPEAAIIAFVRNESDRAPEKAKRLLEEALARQPGSVRLLSAATSFDLMNGKIDRALGRLNRALETRSEVPLLLALRAQTLARADRLEEAERDARQAFERSPELPGVLELILGIYERQGRVDVAIEQLEASESAGLLSPHHRMLLGRLHNRSGNFDRAEELLEAALREDPDLAGAKNDLAFLLARGGRDLDRALELAREAQQVFDDDPQVIDTLGYVMLRRGLAAPAADQLGRALRLAEQRGRIPAILHYHMGLALRALGQEEAAAKHLAQALSINPEFAGAQDAKQQLDEARAATSESSAPPS
jgi:tetratricopeptide (TPR) repeat protein